MKTHWLIRVVVLLICFIQVGCGTSRHPESPVLTPTNISINPPSWMEITPGVTELQSALELLGKPTNVSETQHYRVYDYYKRNDLTWKYVEIWVKKGQEKDKVSAILRAVAPGAPVSAQSLLIQYGIPEKVTWGSGSYERYWIWASKGIAAEFSVNIRWDEWNDKEWDLTELFIFTPMKLEEFLNEPWPWGTWGFSADNLFENTDAPDTYPEDPYDWEHMPTPLATGTP